VRNGVLHVVKEKRNILHAVKRRKPNWIGHTLPRNCLLKHFIEGNIEAQKSREYEEENVSNCWMTLRPLSHYTVSVVRVLVVRVRPDDYCSDGFSSDKNDVVLLI
jgi:hypothetical protein